MPGALTDRDVSGRINLRGSADRIGLGDLGLVWKLGGGSTGACWRLISPNRLRGGPGWLGKTGFSILVKVFSGLTLNELWVLLPSDVGLRSFATSSPLPSKSSALSSPPSSVSKPESSSSGPPGTSLGGIIF